MLDKPRVRTVIRAGFGQFERTRRLASHVRKAARRIFSCKTPSLGKHVHICENGHEHVQWNSCRHRSCPECSWPARKRWLAKTASRLLDCAHHHVVFTFASELNGLWLANIPEMQRLLFRYSTETLFELFADRYRAAIPGIIAVLHTWGRALALHPHLHLILTRGGVDALGRWLGPKKHRKAVLSVEAVSELFKRKFLAAVRRGLIKGRLVLPRGTDAAAMDRLIAEADEKRWSVFIGHAGTRVQTIISYLGRYVSGGPIGNGRILGLDGKKVTFQYRDYRKTGPDGRPAEYPMKLTRLEFLRRWFLHVPLPYAKTVRSFGLYSPAYRGPSPRPPRRRGVAEPQPATPPSVLDVLRCPDCGMPLKLACVVRPERQRAPPQGRLG